MGGKASVLEGFFQSSSAHHVVMLGLDGAGKTTILYRLKFDQYVNAVPTVGFNCEKVRGSVGRSRGVSFTVWDVGGQDKLRPLWSTYTRHTEGVLFVVDSVCDGDRLEEARAELARVARDGAGGGGVPVIIVANKQDLPHARTPEDLERLLGVREILGPARRPWRVQSACAVTGDGLPELVDALYELMCKRKKTRPASSSAAAKR